MAIVWGYEARILLWCGVGPLYHQPPAFELVFTVFATSRFTTSFNETRRRNRQSPSALPTKFRFSNKATQFWKKSSKFIITPVSLWVSLHCIHYFSIHDEFQWKEMQKPSIPVSPVVYCRQRFFFRFDNYIFFYKRETHLYTKTPRYVLAKVPFGIWQSGL